MSAVYDHRIHVGTVDHFFGRHKTSINNVTAYAGSTIVHQLVAGRGPKSFSANQGNSFVGSPIGARDTNAAVQAFVSGHFLDSWLERDLAVFTASVGQRSVQIAPVNDKIWFA